MASPLQQYLEKLDGLIAAREAAGGELTQDEESRFCDELDIFWRQLTPEEEEQVEVEVETRKKDGRYKMKEGT